MTVEISATVSRHDVNVLDSWAVVISKALPPWQGAGALREAALMLRRFVIAGLLVFAVGAAATPALAKAKPPPKGLSATVTFTGPNATGCDGVLTIGYNDTKAPITELDFTAITGSALPAGGITQLGALTTKVFDMVQFTTPTGSVRYEVQGKGPGVLSIPVDSNTATC
jgi:hypothetical protein